MVLRRLWCLRCSPCIGAYVDWKSHRVAAADAAEDSRQPLVREGTALVAARRCGSSCRRWRACCLLAATNHLCQDVAVIPFLWVVPLSLYLAHVHHLLRA